METDRTLLLAARRMEREALVEIFDLYSSALFKYAVSLCSDPLLADHIVGDVFAKLLEQFATGSGPRENLRAYIYEMTYHRLVDESRYAKRRISLEVLSWRPDFHGIFPSLEDGILYKQVVQAVQSELTADQRHVIVLRFLEQFSIRETAAILRLRSDHVRVIQSRALAALRRFFEYRGILNTRPSALRFQNVVLSRRNAESAEI
jgi:RNA polymerase sigma-70 factor (ECF subfamily)